MQVYVVMGENCLSENGEVCWLVGVYATRELAERAAESDRAEARERGRCVYGEAADDEDECDWDVDVTVHEMTVEGV
jgi:hypothetical protein